MKLNEEQLDMAQESDAHGCWEILKLKLVGDELIPQEGFDIVEAVRTIEEYMEYIDDEDSLPQPEYLTRLYEINNNYLGDDAYYDYCGSYVSMILNNWV